MFLVRLLFHGSPRTIPQAPIGFPVSFLPKIQMRGEVSERPSVTQKAQGVPKIWQSKVSNILIQHSQRIQKLLEKMRGTISTF